MQKSDLPQNRPAVSSRLTRSQLRYRLERLEPPVYLNPKQLEEMIDVGLVPEPDASGTRPNEVIDQARRAHELRDSTRPLDRRVILRATERGNAVSPEKLRNAVDSVLARIARPASKLKRIYAASRAYSTWAVPASEQPLVHPSDVRPHLPVSKWKEVMRTADAQLFAGHFELAAFFDGLMTGQDQAMPESARLHIAKIPREERLALLVLLRLAARRGPDQPRELDQVFA